MDEKKEYKCEICSKFYKNYKSLWKHNHIYHKHQNANNPPITHQKTPENILKCIKCNTIFSRLDSLSRHNNKNRCKINNNEINKKILDIKNEKDKEINELRKEMEKMKNLIQKSLKIHPKTLQRINNQLNNNGTINNITIIQLGKENLSELLTKQEKIKILNRQAMSINDIVELAHTSGKYKNCMNVYITNLQNTIGYKYDEKQNNFIAVNKNELLNDLIDSRMYDIEKFYQEFEEKLDPSRAEKIKGFIERMNEDDCLKGLKKEEIKLILYNNKEAISTILPTTKMLGEDEKELVI